MKTYSLTGAHIKLFINNVAYTSAQSVTFGIDYGIQSQYGIDSPYPQELAPGKITVNGSIQGIRIKNSGGLQSKSIRPLFYNAAASNYISIRIQDRQSGEDIFYCEKCMVTKESHAAVVKTTYRLSFDFVGIIPLMSVDRS
jgi:hypothetical protein